MRPWILNIPCSSEGGGGAGGGVGEWEGLGERGYQRGGRVHKEGKERKILRLKEITK